MWPLNAAINGYRLFRRDRRGKRAGGVALNARRWIEREEPSQKNSHEHAGTLKVRIRV